MFLFVGRLVKRKNVHGLIEAAMALRDRGHAFELWIVGDGPERPSLEELAGSLIADGVTRFFGLSRPSEVGRFYEAADVFVMPTLGDYRSVAVLEALRFGMPRNRVVSRWECR